MKKRAVVTGMGILTALGAGLEANLTGITQGRSAISKITSFDVSGYRVTSGGEVRSALVCDLIPDMKAARRYDRATKLLLTAASEAIKRSGLTGNTLPEDTPIFAGTTLGGMIGGTAFHRALVTGRRAGPSLVLDYLSHTQAARLRDALGLAGAIRTVSNACASGANAIGFAFREILSNEANCVIAAGYDTMSEFTYAGFNSLQALSPTVCRPFDKDRDGLALGEGAAVLIIEELERARSRGARVIAEITGYGESSDSFHITRPDPSGAGAAAAMDMAIDCTGTSPTQIDYINAHGTGTPPNDMMEAAAIRSVFGPYGERVPTSSTKPMTGHLLGGAGAVEAVFTIMAINSGALPPNLNYSRRDPECDLNVVDKPGQRADIKFALSNSFGFGGANAALVFKKWAGQ